MYLKKVEIKGFKSFADKVCVDLEHGITCVVGPNGSGKSNISDAVRWVLGEQSAKSLRGGKMEDVIFAGTDSRKPLGFAEVSITIDNSDNMIAVEYTEITVTRRMYRSGESEYFINRNSCRLKDITELFMDTGVGRDGYSIIGQGRIDEILTSKPEDRREMIEEAAGIVKYKTRKEEAERKLDATQQNVTRINDIISELEIQIEPLKEQSDMAKEFLSLRERLKILDLNIFIHNVEKIKSKLEQLETNINNMQDELVLNTKNTILLEEEYTKIKLEIKQIQDDIQINQNNIFISNNNIEKVQGEINVFCEKILNIENIIKRIEKNNENEKIKLNKIILSKDDNNIKRNQINELLSQDKNLLSLKIDSIDQINNTLSQKDKLIESLKCDVVEILNLISAKKSTVSSLITFKNNIDKRNKQICTEKAIKEKELDEYNKNLSQIQNDIFTLKNNYEVVNNNIDKCKNTISQYEEKKNKYRINLLDYENKYNTINARYKVLNEMESEYEGYTKSVKEIMKYKEKNINFKSGICGIVADLIHVSKIYEVAIEVSLGGTLQNIVTEDEYIAKDCIEYLKRNNYGRATFLPITTISSKINNKLSFGLSTNNYKGFIGYASKLINYDSKYENIFSYLLGKVLVVDNLNNAIEIAKKINYSFKIVTLEGDIINSGGSLTGGSINQKSGNILSRKREIEELDKNLKEIIVLKNNLNEKIIEIDSILKNEYYNSDNLLKDKHSIDISISSLNEKYNLGSLNLDKINNELKNLNFELKQLKDEENDTNIKLDEEQSQIFKLENDNTDISNIINSNQAELKDIFNNRDNLNNDITALKISVAELNQKISTLDKLNENIDLDILACKNSIENAENEKLKGVKEKEDIEKSIFDSKNILNTLLNDIKDYQLKLDDLNKINCDKIKKVENIEIQLRECNSNTEILKNEIHKLDMQKAKIETELDNIQNRIWDDYEISYAAALKYKIEVDSIVEITKDINLIKDRLKEIGNVNVGAIDEFKRVQERYDFLLVQKKDLDDAKNSLLIVINEMTNLMKEKFTNNFQIINKNFNETFKELFGGGRAELVLCNKEEILSSGIDIIAEPPGKKLQNIMLMSGGEKALTAISLLFGILKMKPSPFCILDEIEAALDDVNVSRFADFLSRLSAKTQFIVVTHRKGTMEIADIMYGVTMVEKGISKLVSVKLSESEIAI